VVEFRKRIKVAIRQISEGDAEKFLFLMRQLEEETKFMMCEPGERKTTLEEQAKRIRDILSSDSQTILVAEDDATLVGFVGAFGFNVRRRRHCLHVVIGTLQTYSGLGIGTMLMEALEHWARENNIRRLELTVITRNEPALALYRKMGFEIEGTKKASLLVDSELVDEFYMAKLL